MSPLFVSDLSATFSQFLDACIYDFERSVLAMSLQDVPHCLVCVYSKQFAQVGIQGKVYLSFLQELEYSHVFLLKDDVEGISKI